MNYMKIQLVKSYFTTVKIVATINMQINKEYIKTLRALIS